MSGNGFRSCGTGWSGSRLNRPGEPHERRDRGQIGRTCTNAAIWPLQRPWRTTTGTGGSFLTWFGFFLQTAFAEETGYRTQRQRRDPLRGAVSLDDPVPGTDDLLLSDTVADSEDRIADTEDAIWWDELHTAMLEALGSLPPDCRDILRRRFYQRQTLARAAQETGRTQNRVRQIEAAAIRQLRHPRIARNLQPFAYPDGDIYAAGLRGTGLSVFRRSGESSVERAVFWMERGSGQ